MLLRFDVDLHTNLVFPVADGLGFVCMYKPLMSEGAKQKVQLAHLLHLDCMFEP